LPDTPQCDHVRSLPMSPQSGLHSKSLPFLQILGESERMIVTNAVTYYSRESLIKWREKYG
jgi:hypothetical protein